MAKGLKVDYAEPVEPLKKLIDLGINPNLPEELGLEPVPFIELKPEQQDEVVDFYSKAWEYVLVPEWYAGKIKTSKKTTGLPVKDIIRMCVRDQLHTSGKRFPDGQMILAKKIKGKDRPIILTRSQLWFVPDIPDDKYFDNYPTTWYLVSGDGNGYPWIPMLVNGKPKKFMDYEEVLGRENPRLNEEINFVISHYALTKNMAEECDVDGASRAAVAERARYAVKKWIKHCDTCSPLNNFIPWVKEKERRNPNREYTPNDFIKENVVERLEGRKNPKGGKRKKYYYTAIGMHMKYGAWSMRILPEARKCDKDSDGHCGFCRYF